MEQCDRCCFVADRLGLFVGREVVGRLNRCLDV